MKYFLMILLLSNVQTISAADQKFDPSIGENDKYYYCELAGLANGSDRQFIGSIASALIQIRYGGHSGGCGDVWGKAYKDMQAAQKDYKNTYTQRQLLEKIQIFEHKVIKAIISIEGSNL